MIKINTKNQCSYFSIILVIATFVLFFNDVECSNKKGCDNNCIKSCPREKEDVCGSDGKVYESPCILKCCGEAEVDTSVCSENGMRRADTGTQKLIGNQKSNGNGSKKKGTHNRIPCEIDCYNSCSDDDEIVCGDNGKIFENVCKMDCCGIDEAKMKFCKENGSKRAKIVKVQNVEEWKKSNAENDEVAKERSKNTSISKDKGAKTSAVMPKKINNNQEKENSESVSKTDKQKSISKERNTSGAAASLKKRDDDLKNDQTVPKPKNNDKIKGIAVLKQSRKN